MVVVVLEILVILVYQLHKYQRCYSWVVVNLIMVKLLLMDMISQILDMLKDQLQLQVE